MEVSAGEYVIRSAWVCRSHWTRWRHIWFNKNLPWRILIPADNRRSRVHSQPRKRFAQERKILIICRIIERDKFTSLLRNIKRSIQFLITFLRSIFSKLTWLLNVSTTADKWIIVNNILRHSVWCSQFQLFWANIFHPWSYLGGLKFRVLSGSRAEEEAIPPPRKVILKGSKKISIINFRCLHESWI